LPNNTPEFTITRTFNAPRDLLFQAWSDPQRMAQWWGPRGFMIQASNLDFRVGGSYHYCLLAPDGLSVWGKFVYRGIDIPSRLVWVNSFSDEKGNVIRHPFSPNWPLELLTDVTFVEQGNQTKVTVQWIPLNSTAAETQAFEMGRMMMQQGWIGTFDQLAEYLSKA
jgi:uncharacterized protein YndB with AHSA1/START domain